MALPVITRPPRSTSVRVFSTGSFKCTARSYGTVSLSWKKIDSELPPTADIAVSRELNEITSILRLQSIGYYKGYYYCVAENSAGKVNSTFAHFDIIGMYIDIHVCHVCCNFGITYVYVLKPVPQCLVQKWSYIPYPLKYIHTQQ